MKPVRQLSYARL